MGHERGERESSDSLSSERSREAAPTETRAGSQLGVFAGRAGPGRFGAGQQGPPGGGDQGRFDGDQPEAVAASALAFQAKLAVGGSEDPAEREADAVAAEVVSRIARRDFSEEPEEVNRSPAQRIRRRATVGNQGGPVDTDTEQRIQARRGNGTALPPDVAEQMGAGFGTDFSNVRLHTGAESAELNSRLQARAFTVGNDIFLGNDTNIRSSDGQELLAHELTHTIQQSPDGRVQRLDLVHRQEIIRRDETPRTPEQEAAAKAEFVSHFVALFDDVTWLDTPEGFKKTADAAEMVWLRMYKTMAATAPLMADVPAVAGTGFKELTVKGDRYKASADGETQTVVGTDPKFKEALSAAEEFANMLKDLTKQSPKAKKLAEDGFAFWSGDPAMAAAAHENSGLQSLEGSQLGGIFQDTKIPEGAGTDMSIWGSLSKAYAEWATEGMDGKGRYKGFVGLGGDRLDSIYNSVERWAFQKAREGQIAGISFTFTWHAVIPERAAYAEAASQESGGAKARIERNRYEKGPVSAGGSDVGPVGGFGSRVDAANAMREADAARRRETGKLPE